MSPFTETLWGVHVSLCGVGHDSSGGAADEGGSGSAGKVVG
ncbi:MAG: hypothetical protein SGJ20_18375 [Planctomycetota bacterium]|nr:hypothetical protein [Planctomycetota bacterium]